jgi:hypothetical protein
MACRGGEEVVIAQAKQSLSICRECGAKPVENGHCSCAECLAENAARTKRQREDRSARGLCERCGIRAPLDNRKRCGPCREQERAYERQRQERLRVGRQSGPTAYRQNQYDFIARYSGKRSLEWIGQHLSISPKTVLSIIYAEGLAPTQRDDLLTTSHVADILGYSQQWIIHLCSTGRMRAWRNPTSVYRGRRNWLIPRDEVSSWCLRQGKPRDDPRLTDPLAWPRAILRRGRIR